jgi:hypothetical protein
VTGLVYWLLDGYSHQGDPWSARFAQVLDALGPSGEPPGPLFGGSYEGFAAALEQQCFGHYAGFRVLGTSSASPPPFHIATLLPMFPQLRLIADAAGGTITIDFANENRTPANYQAAVDMYFQALGQLGAPPADAEAAALDAGAPLTGPSIANYLFGDYFVMLVRYVFQQLRGAAQDSHAQHEAMFFSRVEAAGTAPAAAFEVTDAVAAFAEAVSGANALNDLLDSFNYASAAGIASRFMLHGLQLPIPADVPSNPTPQNMPAVPTDGIYALSGQQFPIAAGVTTGTAMLELSPASPPTGWISFGESGSDPSVTGTTTLPPAAPAMPAITWRGISSPSSGLPNEIDIRSMPAVVSQQLGFALKNRVNWLASTGVSPGEQRVILPLPQPMQAVAASHGGLGLQLSMQTPSNGGVARMAAAPMSGAPALLIRLSISQVQKPSNVDVAASGSPSLASSPGGTSAPQYVPFVYQLGGADEATRELIYQALQDPNTLNGATVTLLYTPPGSGTSQSDLLVPDALLAKTNLSTLNQAPQVSFAHAEMMTALDAQYDLDWALVNGQVNEFLRLVWEVSVVQAPGFYLYYQTTDGKGLPSDLFADTAAAVTSPQLSGTVNTTGGQSAQFDILVQFAEPQQAVQLPSYGNAIWVTNPGSANPVYALVSDRAGNAIPQYTSGYPAGSIGFEIDWTPVIETPPPLVPVNELYHLIQYRVAQAGAYMPSVWSLPVGPTAGEQASVTSHDMWRFQHTLPVTNFLNVGSPINRYDIIGRPVELEFTVVDISGNPLPGRYDAGFTPLYQDPLISVASWPGVQVAYSFASDGAGAADLVLRLTFDSESLAPQATGSPSGWPPASPGGATNTWHRQLRSVDRRYQLILDQLNDPHTSVTVTSSLMPAGSPLGDPVSTLVTFVEEIRDEIALLLQQTAPSPPAIISPPITSRIVLPVPYASVVGLPADILPLTVTIQMQRTPTLVDPAARQNMPAATAISFAVPPDMSNPPSGSPNAQNSPIRRFAQQFEAAFAGFDGHAGKLSAQRQIPAREPHRLPICGWCAGARPPASRSHLKSRARRRTNCSCTGRSSPSIPRR